MVRYVLILKDWEFSLLSLFQDGRRNHAHPQHSGSWARQDAGQRISQRQTSVSAGYGIPHIVNNGHELLT
jgi:hypothetical protein